MGSRNVFQHSAVKLTTKTDQTGVAVTLRDWNFIKNKLKSLRCPAQIWSLAGSLIAGTGLGLATQLISDPTNKIVWLWAIALIVIGLLCLVIDHKERKVLESRPREILDHMERIEDMFETDS